LTFDVPTLLAPSVPCSGLNTSVHSILCALLPMSEIWPHAAAVCIWLFLWHLRRVTILQPSLCPLFWYSPIH
jgi:hypothetical protein